MADQSRSDTDYLIDPEHDVESLKKRVNGLVKQVRCAGQIGEEETAVAEGFIYSYALASGFRMLVGPLGREDAGDFAGDIACAVLEHARRRELLSAWAAKEHRAELTTFLFRYIRWRALSIIESTKAQRAVPHVSLEVSLPTVSGADGDGGEMMLDVEDVARPTPLEILLTSGDEQRRRETLVAVERFLGPDDFALATGRRKLREDAALHGGGVTGAFKRKQAAIERARAHFARR